jgi:hypothetical protein
MKSFPKGVPLVSESHHVLFRQAAHPACDVCGEPLPPIDEEPDFALAGEGMLVWYRGEERRAEKIPLCGGCATAIGVTAMHRWEIEEDEG